MCGCFESFCSKCGNEIYSCEVHVRCPVCKAGQHCFCAITYQNDEAEKGDFECTECGHEERYPFEKAT